MKKIMVFFKFLILCMILILFVNPISAQKHDGPLTFQGLDHYILHSATGRALAGTAIGVIQDPGLMFQNPATLHSIQGLQVSLGGLLLSTKTKQEQPGNDPFSFLCIDQKSVDTVDGKQNQKRNKWLAKTCADKKKDQ